MRNSGSLNSKISFITRGNGKDGFGGNSMSPEIIFDCWSEVKTQTSREFTAAKGTALENAVTFVVREQLRSKINSSMRIKHNGTYYEIIRINPDVVDNKWCYVMAVSKL